MRRRKRNPWTPSDLRQLKKMAGRLSAPRIARELRRTEGAVRVRASEEGVSLRVPMACPAAHPERGPGASRDLERIDVDRPAHAPRLRQRLDARQPLAEQTLQR